MDLNRRYRPVDRLMVLFNTAFACLWLTAVSDVPYARWIVCAHLSAVLVPHLCTRVGPRPSWLGDAVRELYPIVFIAAFWSELGLVRDAFHAAGNDAFIAAADHLLFGQHLQAVWMPAMPNVWLSEAMFALYVLYYPMVFLLPLFLLIRGRRVELRDVAFTLSVAYLGCYILYALFPVDGPSHTMARYDGPLTNGVFYQLANRAVHAGDSLGTAFPSSHVVGAVTASLLAFKWFSRPIAILYGVEAVAVVLATVYTQNHFAIDSAAGVVLAVFLFWVVTPSLRVALRERRPALLLPPLPVYRHTALGEAPTGGGS